MSPIRVCRVVSCALLLLAFVSIQSLAEVTSLVVDPMSPSTVYAGTEGGVLKSTDGGATWARAGLTDNPVFTLAIDPGVPSLLYALTSTGLLKSANGGETWSAQLENGSLPYWGMIERPSSWTFDDSGACAPYRPGCPGHGVRRRDLHGLRLFYEYVWGDIFTNTDGQGWTGAASDPWSTPWLSAPIIATAAQTDTTPATLYSAMHPWVLTVYQFCGPGGCTRLDQSPEAPTFSPSTRTTRVSSTPA